MTKRKTESTAALHSWLEGKTAADFKIIEHRGGRLLWPVKLNRLRANGKFEQEDAYLQVLDPLEKLDALHESKQEFARLCKERDLDPRDEDCRGFWETLEAFGQLSYALREAKPSEPGVHARKHRLWALLQFKETGISERELANLLQQLDIFAKFEDPRIADLDVETVVKGAMAIADTGNLSPLVDIVGSEVDTFVIAMAKLLTSCLTHELSSQLPANSTKARSLSRNSGGSSAAKPGASPALSDAILASSDPSVA